MIKKREIFGWSMFDFANSGYTTVVLTAIFNSYYVAVVAQDYNSGTATLYWTLTIAIANTLVLISSPIIGAIADHSRQKKPYLAFSTIGCVFFTALLFFVEPGDLVFASSLLILSSILFFTGENLIAAFLPEISTRDNIGKISGYGWTLGYIGGLLVLALCLIYVSWATSHGLEAETFVPITMLIVAFCFGVASLPTFFLLKERVPKSADGEVDNNNAETFKDFQNNDKNYLKLGIRRLQSTLNHAKHHQDMFRFLVALFVYHCGINTIIVIAAIYAQEVMNFETKDTILLIMVVNISAAIGAFLFGIIQDKIGAKKTLCITLYIWIVATLLAWYSSSLPMFWVVANLIGLALGSSQSAGRTLIGLFSPSHKNGEFFGLWGMAIRLSAIVGPMIYGLLAYLTEGNHKIAMLSMIVFFVGGLIILRYVDESRGRLHADIKPV